MICWPAIVAALFLLAGCGADPVDASAAASSHETGREWDEAGQADRTRHETDAGHGEREAAESCPRETCCVFTEDGVCDEPGNCALGTDDADCEAACEDEAKLYLIGAACAYRNEPTSTYPSTLGSGGTLHLTGDRDDVVSVADAESGGVVDRHYRLFVPEDYEADTPMPLVLMLGGHRVSHYSLADYTQLHRSADALGFIVVYAEQTWRWDKFAWSWWTDWQWSTQPTHSPDVDYIEALVEAVAEDYHVDLTRIFTVGHSRGGAMALIAAMELPDLIAGACIQSGFTEFGYDQVIADWSGERKTPLFFVHGTVDPDVCIDCMPGGACGVVAKNCGGSMGADGLVALFTSKGWSGEELYYARLEGVAHRWQPQLNETWFRWLQARPLQVDP